MSKKRDALITTADRLFYTQGFAATGIDRVVSVAGVALGTLYRHFDGKADLVVGVLDYRETAFFEWLDETASGKNGPERVLSLFDALLSWSEQKGGNESGCIFLRAAAEHPEEPAILARVQKHKKTYLAFCRKHLREAGWRATSAQRLAPKVFLLLEGAVATRGVLGNKAAIRQARSAAQDLLNQDSATPVAQQPS